MLWQTSWIKNWKKTTNKEKRKSKVSTKSPSSHTRTHTLAHLQDTMSFHRFCHRFRCCFCPPCSCSCCRCCCYCCCRHSQKIFPVYTMTKQGKTETQAPLSHKVFVDLFILAFGRGKTVYMIQESRWKGLNIDCIGFNRYGHLGVKSWEVIVKDA